MADATRTKIIEAFHRSRMKPYLVAAGHSEKDALKLYRWHSELTSACQSVLGFTEVIVRNSMDRQLQLWNNRVGGDSRSWLLFEPEAPLRSLTQRKRHYAYRQAEKALEARSATHPRFGEVITHDDVLAQLPFGLWKDLLPNHSPSAGDSRRNCNRRRLWDESLRGAFPHVLDESGVVTFWRVARVHSLRNRVSHMESLLDIDVLDIIQDAFDLLRSVDSDVADWVTGASKVSAVLRRKPKVNIEKA